MHTHRVHAWAVRRHKAHAWPRHPRSARLHIHLGIDGAATQQAHACWHAAQRPGLDQGHADQRPGLGQGLAAQRLGLDQGHADQHPGFGQGLADQRPGTTAWAMQTNAQAPLAWAMQQPAMLKPTTVQPSDSSMVPSPHNLGHTCKDHGPAKASPAGQSEDPRMQA